MTNWFTADTHFGHANIIKYCNRPFKDVQEMDEILIKNWNDRVQQGDNVYLLGDFSMGDPTRYVQRLNGRIHVIRGNHDKHIMRAVHLFEWVRDLTNIHIDGQDIVLCHYAMRVWQGSHRNSWQCYGHSHGTLADNPTALSCDVGVDCHNYCPISFEQLKTIMARKNYQPVDHHKPRE